MGLKRVRGVFFDLDDTLIGYREALLHAVHAAWQHIFGESHTIDAAALPVAVLEAYAERYGYGTPGYAELATLASADLRRQVTRDALVRLGVDAPEAVERLVAVVEAAEREQLGLNEGALEVLDTLRRGGLKVGLITNGPSLLQREKLERLNLAGHFDVAVVDSEFGHPKPDPRIFEHAAAAGGLAPREIVFVGDTPEADIAGAKAAGCTAVWFNPARGLLPEKSQTPDFEVEALVEILALPPVREVLGS